MRQANADAAVLLAIRDRSFLSPGDRAELTAIAHRMTGRVAEPKPKPRRRLSDTGFIITNDGRRIMVQARRAAFTL